MATAQATKNNITLKGSTAIVTEFFGYAVNSILYQRGIYPETFERKQKYGLGMLVTTDESLKAYLVNVLQQINDWMMSKMFQKLVLRSRGWEQRGAERGVRHEQEEAVDEDGTAMKEKPAKEISQEISAIIRQITASVTFLPLLGGVHVRPPRVHQCGERRAGGVEERTRGTSRATPNRSSSVLLHLRAQG